MTASRGADNMSGRPKVLLASHRRLPGMDLDCIPERNSGQFMFEHLYDYSVIFCFRVPAPGGKEPGGATAD